MAAATVESDDDDELDDALDVEDGKEETVCIIIDISPAAYARGTSAAPLEEAVSAVWSLLNVLTSLASAQRRCRVMVLGLLPGRYVSLYDPLLSGEEENASDVLCSSVERELEAFGFSEAGTGDAGGRCAPVSLAPALAKALCWIHKSRGGVMAAATDRLLRQRGASGSMSCASEGSQSQNANGFLSSARMLVVLASEDPAEQYVGVMNAIFAAQSAGAVIDGVPLHRPAGARSPPRSEFLQQMCSLTGGSYVAPMRDDALINYFKLFLATGVRERRKLLVSGADAGCDNVGNRPSCFCHKRAIAIGYVCSVCLSVFCYRVDACLMCGQRFVGPTPTGARVQPIPKGGDPADART